MNLFEEYKDLYYKELEHSDRLNDKVHTGITFLTILGSGQILLWNQFINIETNVLSYIYLAGCLISFALFIGLLFLFYNTYNGYSYNYFPIQEMANVVQETLDIVENIQYEDNEQKQENKKRANQHIEDMFSERFLNDTINNRKNNIIKSNRRKKFITAMSISLIFTILLYATGTTINYIEDNATVTTNKSIVINGGESSMAEDKEIKLTSRNNTTVDGTPFPDTPNPQVIVETFTRNMVQDNTKDSKK